MQQTKRSVPTARPAKRGRPPKTAKTAQPAKTAEQANPADTINPAEQAEQAQPSQAPQAPPVSPFAQALTVAGEALDIVEKTPELAAFYFITSREPKDNDLHSYARLQTHGRTDLAEVFAEMLYARPEVRLLVAHALYFFKERMGYAIAPHKPAKNKDVD